MCPMCVYIKHCTGGMLQPLKEEACSAWTFFYTLALLIAQKKILRYLPLKRTRLFVNKCIPF